MLVYTFHEDGASLNKVIEYDPANKILPAILLIISVLLFRLRFNGKQSQRVIANEKLIVVHVTLFVFYAITYVSYLILTSYFINSAAGTMEQCRFLVTDFYFECFYTTVNIATLILYIYMSVMFSRPLNGYWNEFLLSYRE